MEQFPTGFMVFMWEQVGWFYEGSPPGEGWLLSADGPKAHPNLPWVPVYRIIKKEEVGI